MNKEDFEKYQKAKAEAKDGLRQEFLEFIGKQQSRQIDPLYHDLVSQIVQRLYRKLYGEELL